MDLRPKMLHPTLAKGPDVQSPLNEERISSPDAFMKRFGQGAPGIKHKDGGSRISSTVFTILVQAEPGQWRTVGKGMKVNIVAGSANQLNLIKGWGQRS